jgi:soluble lytic murein transglycosylase
MLAAPMPRYALPSSWTATNRRSPPRVVAVIKGQPTALRMLDALSAAAKKDPVAIYSRVQTLRRANRYRDAGTFLLEAPTDPKLLVDPDAWWVERRLVSRVLAEAGDPKTAYRIATAHVGESPAVRAEAEFHAGWYALEFLHDPATAMKHFAAISQASPTPLSISRGEYWLAGRYRGRRQGQCHGTLRKGRRLSRHLPWSACACAAWSARQSHGAPTADAAVTMRFVGRELVQVIQHLTDEV